MRKLGVRPGDSESDDFFLPDHVDKAMSASESAEVIADYFSKISMEYDPIDVTKFPPKIKESLAAIDTSLVPSLSVHEVYQKIRKAKKPNSVVPGDLPKK